MSKINNSFEENKLIPLKSAFRKNGLGYSLIQRNNKVALFALSTCRHWEVARIYVLPEGERFDKHYPDTETISHNDNFGIDGSKAFMDKDRALKYFTVLSRKLDATKTVKDLSYNDSKVVPEYSAEEIEPLSVLHNATDNKIPKERLNRRQAIRAKCYDCSTYDWNEVNGCTYEDCDLHPYRTSAGGQNPKERHKAIRKYCLWCVVDRPSELRHCPPDCPLHEFRYYVRKSTPYTCVLAEEQAEVIPEYHPGGVFQETCGGSTEKTLKT